MFGRVNSHMGVSAKFIAIFLIVFAGLPCELGYSATLVSRFGITWTFDKDYTIGTFANGDYYVVGDPDVTITDIDPASQYNGARVKNGSMVNPLPSVSTQGFDSALTSATYTDSRNAALNVITGGSNLTLNAGDSLVSTISISEAAASRR